jgi:hypothetical protein
MWIVIACESLFVQILTFLSVLVDNNSSLHHLLPSTTFVLTFFLLKHIRQLMSLNLGEAIDFKANDNAVWQSGWYIKPTFYEMKRKKGVIFILF